MRHKFEIRWCAHTETGCSNTLIPGLVIVAVALLFEINPFHGHGKGMFATRTLEFSAIKGH